MDSGSGYEFLEFRVLILHIPMNDIYRYAFLEIIKKHLLIHQKEESTNYLLFSLHT